jgi:hypothetical protein
MEDKTRPVGLRHDKVTVTPLDATAGESDKSYAVAITGLAFADAKSSGLTVGEIDYRLTAAEAGTYRVSDLKLPADLPVIGPEGKPVADLKFEPAGFSALWSTPLQSFLKLDWQAKNVAATAMGRSGAAAPDLTFKAEAMAIAVDGKDNGKGRLDQSAQVTLSGIAVLAPRDDVNVTLAKVSSKVAVDDFDFPAYRQQMTRLREISSKLAPGMAQPADPGTASPATPAGKMTDADRKALAEIVAALPKTMSGYSTGFGVEGLAVTHQDGTVPVRLAEGGMDFALKGIDTDKAELDLALRHDGLEMTGPDVADPMAKAMLPKSGNLALAATDLPVPSLVEAIAKQIPLLTSADPAVAQGAQFGLMGAVMTALSQSSIALRIDPSHLDAGGAHLTAEGALKLAMTSPTMAAGTVNFALTGLDDLIALATRLAPQSPDALQAMGMLQMLQTLAQRETGTDGKPVDKFKLDLTEAGQVQVNGKPLDGTMP